MKTLVFFGSPRKNGSTKQLLDIFMDELGGEFEIIDCYKTRVSACVDCKYCWKEHECAIKDGMQEIYQKVEQSDNIILATPMYFHMMTGPMKVIMDRFQVYWASSIRENIVPTIKRKGASLIVAGASEFESQFGASDYILNDMLENLQCDNIGRLSISNTDQVSVKDNSKAVAKVKEFVKKFNES